jgi:hypothetical protein
MMDDAGAGEELDDDCFHVKVRGKKMRTHADELSSVVNYSCPGLW